MIAFAPLWADVEWLRFLVPAVMFAVWVLNRLLGGESPAARQAKARQQARVNPPPPPADKQRVDDEVSEFLRRAAQQRSGHTTRTPAPAMPPQPPSVVRKPGSAEARRAGAAVAETTQPSNTPRTLAPTLSASIGSRHLGGVQPKEVEQAEAAMQSHLTQVFGHNVGSLGDVQTATSELADVPADRVSALLRDPQTIRDAIIVSEILRRPEERW
ncbi:MAG TPA: hypothetical protein VGN12_25040 [Pirellulales bacterium]|jgi:hypothetical protein